MPDRQRSKPAATAQHNFLVLMLIAGATLAASLLAVQSGISAGSALATTLLTALGLGVIASRQAHRPAARVAEAPARCR